MRAFLLQIMWQIGSRFGRRRPADPGDVAAHDYRTQTRQMGVTMTDRIRDTFRSRWLRLRK